MDKNFRDAALAAFKRSAIEAAEKQKTDEEKPPEEAPHEPSPAENPAMMETQSPVEMVEAPEEPEAEEPEAEDVVPASGKGKPLSGKAGKGGSIPAMKRKPGGVVPAAAKPAVAHKPVPAAARREEAPKAPVKAAAAPPSAPSPVAVAGTSSFTRSRIAPPTAGKEGGQPLLVVSVCLNAILLGLVILLLILLGSTMGRIGSAEKKISDIQAKTLPKMQADMEVIKQFSLKKFGVYEHPMKGLQGVIVTYDETGKSVGTPRIMQIKGGQE
ncbi:MAG: hypothetical protein A3K19_23095 [Lentisphaerae bacterium RIFOXYB12_FULL_65_16]|nr:MAG: hypothetical protein A3K18_14205 [Lentisphaerae bacterium RIFOXYA12_64_32]OGV84968.1 MAG: hypothetical protein A3K19_23095 [Lentisphaerae bacterium RIFOXYB12_FULL_65_16]